MVEKDLQFALLQFLNQGGNIDTKQSCFFRFTNNGWHFEYWEVFFQYVVIDPPLILTESLNSLIRVINRLGRGYSFEALQPKYSLQRGLQSKLSLNHKLPPGSETHRMFQSSHFPPVTSSTVSPIKVRHPRLWLTA
jgi:hypothetical protein